MQHQKCAQHTAHHAHAISTPACAIQLPTRRQPRKHARVCAAAVAPPSAHHQPRSTALVHLHVDRSERGGTTRTVCKAAQVAPDAPVAGSSPPPQPLTLVSGFQGAGKTSLLRHVLAASNSSGARSASVRTVVLGSEGAGCLLQAEGGGVADASNGSAEGSTSTQLRPWTTVSRSTCSCCAHDEGTGMNVLRLQQQLAAKAVQQQQQQQNGAVLVECPSMSVPLHMATQLQGGLQSQQEESPGTGQPLELDTLVTVVDALQFCPMIRESEYLADIGLTEDEADDRTVADVLVEQVEYANVLVINKADLAAEEQLNQLEHLLRRLNRSAQIIRAVRGQVPAEQVLSTGRFGADELQQAPGWLAEIDAFSDGLQGQVHSAVGESIQGSGHATNNGSSSQGGGGHSSSDSHGVHSFVYFAQRPFHPQRLMDQALSTEWQGVVRSKGFFWVASRHDIMGAWQSAGAAWQGEPSALWEVVRREAADPDTNPPDQAEGPSTSSPPFSSPSSSTSFASSMLWHEHWGDRCQLITWIGINMDEQQLRAMLDSCLLSNEEMARGPEAWEGLEDPLPSWRAGPGEEGSEDTPVDCL